MENYLLKKEDRFPLLEYLSEASVQDGFMHLSSELAFYGITENGEIGAAVEGCLRILRNVRDDSQRHFRRTFACTPEGIRPVWMISEQGWELLLMRIAPASPALSQKLLHRIGSRRKP